MWGVFTSRFTVVELGNHRRTFITLRGFTEGTIFFVNSVNSQLANIILLSSYSSSNFKLLYQSRLSFNNPSRDTQEMRYDVLKKYDSLVTSIDFLELLSQKISSGSAGNRETEFTRSDTITLFHYTSIATMVEVKSTSVKT